jgi:methylenetetrahydrofolate dehydrogenase (NADP+)/methenyltetrahydrofolate cyclohydrolase
LEKVRQEVIRLRNEGKPPPTLAEIRVGAWPPDTPLHILQAQACRFTGISHQVHVFPQPDDSQRILLTLADLNADPRITGIAIHTCPSTRLGELAVALAPRKDVDGVQPLNLGRFLTNQRIWRRPRGADIVQLLKRVGYPLEGLRVICIGNASGFGGMLAWLCLHENATVSAWRAPTTWPMEMLQHGDVLILDTDDLPAMDGVALKPGVIVVDARYSPDGWLPHRPEDLPQAVALLIAVPGGMGPMTPARRLAALVAMCRTPTSGSLDS